VGAMRDSKVIQVFELLELFLYRKAACIIPVTHSFKKVLVNRGIDANKIHVVTNGVDVSRYSPQIKDKKLISRFQLQDKFVVGYIGTHGMAHALETILKAAKLLSVKNDNDSIHFVLLGNGAKKVELMRLAEEMQLDNVTFFDSVLKDEVVRYWSLLDVSIIHLKRTPLFQSVIPSKLFESMGMGIPVLCGVEGESAEIVNRDKVGLTFIPEDETDLINKLTTLQTNTDLYQQFSNNCLAMAHVYDRTELANKMLNVLESINAENLTNHRLKKKIVEIDERLKVNLK
ncbi:MAG: glycosyltransferase family 4 protein, partial [Methylococcales bacterium]